MRHIFEEIRASVQAGDYAQVDETPIRYLEPGNGQTKLGYLWVAHRPGGDTVYHWETSRAAACLERSIPAGFTGTLQCDGYSASDAFARDRPEIALIGCWAHARRKFYEAAQQGCRRSALVLHPAKPLSHRSQAARHKGWPEAAVPRPCPRKPARPRAAALPPAPLENQTPYPAQKPAR